MVTTIITAMAAYSNERVAAIVISVLYRMLTTVVVMCDLWSHNYNCFFKCIIEHRLYSICTPP